MNLEKVIFGFFIVLAATQNLAFVYGDPADPMHHPAAELFIALVVNLIATVLKFGDRTQLGAIHLATSLVAVLQLCAASVFWFWPLYVKQSSMTTGTMVAVVSLSVGALLANIISVIILIVETTIQRR